MCNAGMSGWGGCLDGQDIYSKMAENSLCGEVVADLMADTPAEGVEWRLHGKDADWFFLDGGVIRLNSSPEKILDREVFPDNSKCISLSMLNGKP